MKTSVYEHVFGSMPAVDTVIRENIVADNDEPFFVLDIQDILRKHKNWLVKLPRVRPFYAVKCNNSPMVLELLAALGLSFDCASRAEIDTIMSLGVSSSNIIYANPCKTKSYIQHAAQVGVDLMTFDNEYELYKVRQMHPNARLVVRIKVDDSKSVCRLGLKFGADLDKVAHLLQVAKNIGLNVVGCSFHVGSGSESADAFADAILNAKYVFELGNELGFNMTLLDIGGGFPGTTGTKVTFDDIVKVVNESLAVHFPEFDELGNQSPISIIAEPGRYYAASAFTLVTNIIAKRVVPMDNGELAMMYYLNDGVYGSFNCTIFDHWDVNPEPFLLSDSGEMRPSHLTTLWGPTCDSMDCIKRDFQLVEMNIGEWLVFREMGAYTMAAGSEFNGFKAPAIHYYVPSYVIEMFHAMPAWPRIARILDIDTDDGGDINYGRDHHIIPVH